MEACKFYKIDDPEIQEEDEKLMNQSKDSAIVISRSPERDDTKAK